MEETIPLDDLPIATNAVFDETEDESHEGEHLLTDTGLNDGGLTVTIVTDVVNGTLTLNADGSFVYHPIANYHGTDNFVYQVCDGDNDCDQASVNITVISVDDFPLAQDDAISVGEDSELFTLYVLADNGNGADDFGGDGPSIGSINLISTSTNGTTELNDGSTPNDPTDDYFIYTPNRNYFGPDAFEYEICDSDGDCDHAIVYIEVINDEVLFFPEVITPNNDGYNDYFVIEGLELFPDNLLIILNRWGNKVFEASPYQNDWNGINQSGLSPGGEELQEGTYYYILKTNNEREDIKGYIYIKR
jgi:gliding motility-associated-like protein